ncbi:CRP/FNR family nitrogen fixation transcriptional regulator [Nitrobacter vulgaris]|uniref:Nitrogen fixation protein FixK n=1 Tax=Nitrobacter vulgaris TaxID=29421 RepID=A0A1V4HVX8_NITVU|nr:helix-turn-helix domain-containing protein [Nitrobacter vulgaris]MDR6305187.1 CRP/FNR family nitrogen fixation transcriptional regulator [Nitrobacter vulgaris]OPH81995.1 nitrogen fixation protein FixK [Nitrobacter vulgaris]
MHTETITGLTAKVLDIPHVLAADQFGEIVRGSGVVPSEFSYRKDEEIYGEGEPSEYLYQTIGGAVRTYKLLSDGRRQIGAFHLPGDVFGLDPGLEHRLTAEAIVDTTVRLVPRRSLEKAAASNAQVARNLWTLTASDLRHAEDHMLLLGRKTAIERVATFLLEMDRRLAKTGMMALPMCRRDIGDYLGLTLETVSRALSQLNDQGILMFSSARQIALRNRQRLTAMEA